MDTRNLEEIKVEDYDIVADEPAELESSINIHNITHDDMKNGDGLRVVLWVAGCSHHCKECQNPQTWDPNGGIPFTQWEESELFEWLDKPWTQGITFSGGDPLHEANRNYIGQLIDKIVKTRPNKDIWLYTGYKLVESREGFVLEDGNGNQFSYPQLKYIDVLVDGRFECDIRKHDIASGRKVLWRGSSNQRIIDVKKTLEKGKIVIKEE